MLTETRDICLKIKMLLSNHIIFYFNSSSIFVLNLSIVAFSSKVISSKKIYCLTNDSFKTLITLL